MRHPISTRSNPRDTGVVARRHRPSRRSPLTGTRGLHRGARLKTHSDLLREARRLAWDRGRGSITDTLLGDCPWLASWVLVDATSAVGEWGRESDCGRPS